jgi:hypothetical protein
MILSFLLMATSATAQPAVEVTIGRVIDSTIGTAEAISEHGVTAGGLLVEQRFASDRLRLYYDLDTGDFSTPGEWSYFLHRVGTTYTANPGWDTGRLYLGGVVTWRHNGASWAAAGYRGIGLFGNLEARPRADVTWRAGYRLDLRRFPDYPELDQAEHGLFTSLLVNLPTRTTLIGEVRTGRKSYGGLVVSVPAATDLDGTHSGVASGTWGRGMGGSPGIRASATQLMSGAGDTAGQVAWLFRVAQSLADRTGASAQFYQRQTFGTLPAIMVETPALFFDDGVYDDPYGSEQRTVSASLKQVFTRGDVVEGWAVWTQKHYTATPAYGLDAEPLSGEPLRADRLWRAGATWTHPFMPDKTGPVAVDLLVTYAYTKHASNDLFYNYRSHVFGVAASVGF